MEAMLAMSGHTAMAGHSLILKAVTTMKETAMTIVAEDECLVSQMMREARLLRIHPT